MKAAFLSGPRRIEIGDLPEPRIIGPRDVLVRIEAVGVCGSDMHYYSTGRIGSAVVEYPFILGHECAGTVQQVGPEVRGLQPGQRVAIDPLVACGRFAGSGRPEGGGQAPREKQKQKYKQKGDTSNELMKGTFLKSFDTGKFLP